MLDRVRGLQEKMEAVLGKFEQGVDSPQKRIELSLVVARLVEETFLVLNNLFQGVFVYYNQRLGQMVFPRYACWIYAHIFYEFKHSLYPLLEPLKTSLAGKSTAPQIITVSLSGLSFWFAFGN